MKIFKKFQVVLAALLIVVGLSACTMNMPISATSNPVGSKVGESEGIGILMFITMYGDATIVNAAKNGGITKISTVDFKVDNILGIYQKYTCVVTGE